MAITRFRDIPQFTRCAGYHVHQQLPYLLKAMHGYIKDGLDMNPDFQRGYVWTDAQKIAFMEYMLRGGQSGMDLYFNCPGWNHEEPGDSETVDGVYRMKNFVIVDGKQRLSAAMGFLLGEFPVFGSYFGAFTDHPRIIQGRFSFHINDLRTRKEVLTWYLEMNTGGTIHSDEEIQKVKSLISEES